MMRIVVLILLVVIVWKGIPFVASRLLKFWRGQDVVRPLNDREDRPDD
jgi:hypothetical protein